MKKLAMILAVAGAMLAFHGMAHGGVTFTKIALTGDSAPGTSGATFTHFDKPPTINSSGKVCFEADLSTGGEGVWKGDSSALSKVAVSGEAAPGGSYEFECFENELIDDNGNVALWAYLDTTGGGFTNDKGLWKETGSSNLGAVAIDDSATWDAVSMKPSYNLAGDVAFKGKQWGSSSPNELWSDASGSLMRIVGEGDSVPGMSGVTFACFREPLGLNSSGKVAFGAGLSDNDDSIWIGDASSLTLVAHEGDTIDGKTLTNLYNVGARVNDNGDVVFAGDFSSDPYQDGIFAYRSGGLTCVVAHGDAAPGTASDTFGTLDNDALINSSGAVAFRGKTASSGQDGIWIEQSGTIQKVMLEGDAAPGLSGVTFDNMYTDFAFNGNGQVAFYVQLAGTGVDSSNDGSVWASDASGDLTLLVREGDAINIEGTDYLVGYIAATYTFWEESGGEDGLHMAFNDDGQLALTLGSLSANGGTSYDYEGIFVVPEPATLALMGLGGVFALIRRRRK